MVAGDSYCAASSSSLIGCEVVGHHRQHRQCRAHRQRRIGPAHAQLHAREGLEAHPRHQARRRTTPAPPGRPARWCVMVQRTVVSQAPRAVRSIRSTDTSAPRAGRPPPCPASPSRSAGGASILRSRRWAATGQETRHHLPQAQPGGRWPASTQARPLSRPVPVTQRSSVTMVWRMRILRAASRRAARAPGGTGRLGGGPAYLTAWIAGDACPRRIPWRTRHRPGPPPCGSSRRRASRPPACRPSSAGRCHSPRRR